MILDHISNAHRYFEMHPEFANAFGFLEASDLAALPDGRHDIKGDHSFVVIARKCGGSTGANLFGALALAEEMIERGERGSIVTLICDPGERYLNTYYNPEWIAAEGLDIKPHLSALERFQES